MKALKIIGIILVVIIGLFLIAGLIAKKDYEVSRSIVINAPASVIFHNISTFEQFSKWDPWEKKDSSMTVKNEGTDGTVGAKHTWESKNMGTGSLTITKIEPNKNVEYALDFIKPFEAHNTAYLSMEPAEGNAYKVTWGMHGHSPFPFNAMGLFMNMDKMIGKDYEEGLQNMKTLCESEKSAYEIKTTEWTEKNCVSIRKTVGFNDLSKFYADSYGKLYEAVVKAGGKPGIPLGVYYNWDEKKMETDVAAALPVDAKRKYGKDITELNLPSAKAYTIDYYGAYQNMKPAYDEIHSYIKKNFNRDMPDYVIEEYLSDPEKEKDTAKWLTKIYFFVKES